MHQTKLPAPTMKQGYVTAIRGSVIDARFPHAPLDIPDLLQTGSGTGSKAFDLLALLEQSGNADRFDGARIGKTVLIMDMIHTMVGEPQGVNPFFLYTASSGSFRQTWRPRDCSASSPLGSATSRSWRLDSPRSTPSDFLLPFS